MNMPLKTGLGFTALSLFVPRLLLCLHAGCTTHAPTAAVLQRLQGTCEGVLVGAEKNGKITITNTGNSLHFYWDTNFWFETMLTLPAGTIPQQLRKVQPQNKNTELPKSTVTVGESDQQQSIAGK